MAGNESLAATLNFMSDAAHLLAQTAPETSANLMSQRNVLMFHSNLDQSSTQRQHVCGACGRIMVPGDGSLISLRREKMRPKKRTSRQQPKPTEPNKYKILTCETCGRYTKIGVSAAPSISRTRIRLKQTARSISSQTTAAPLPVVNRLPPLTSKLAPEPAKVSANAGSKKRAKNRKQGLQALLEQSQSSTPKMGLGLSFTDFMKK